MSCRKVVIIQAWEQIKVNIAVSAMRGEEKTRQEWANTAVRSDSAQEAFHCFPGLWFCNRIIFHEGSLVRMD